MYAFVTENEAVFFDTHIEAFKEYNDSKNKIKAVFDIRSKEIKEVNISANHWDGSFGKLLRKLKERLREEQDEEN